VGGPHHGHQRGIAVPFGEGADDDPPDPKRHRLELYRIHVDQINPGAGQSGIVDLYDGDRWLLDC
jgi:hypothetical protein